MDEPHILIIGIGNPDRGDDAAGHAAATRLRERLGQDRPDTVEVIEHWGEATVLVEAMVGRDKVILIDAAHSSNAIGGYRIFEVGDAPLPAKLTETSSHGLGLAQAIELARALGSLPHRCRVYAIEGEVFETGKALSQPVQAAVDDVVDDILKSLDMADA